MKMNLETWLFKWEWSTETKILFSFSKWLTLITTKELLTVKSFIFYQVIWYRLLLMKILQINIKLLSLKNLSILEVEVLILKIGWLITLKTVEKVLETMELTAVKKTSVKWLWIWKRGLNRSMRMMNTDIFIIANKL